ncbi:M28 family peptidase [Thiospirochaeta perfilievii]|uniref:M28 family peptidase n=1 Tax=Thiospirochaeta perfilievii TaxID=252967 RepID=A0A5C1QEH6_9SPIO|nr:M28 family peptidase [Thiospirochaeta perfilievii]QEN05991.1 M28 family peptidase [Thiospirochaeta perfilievii]
MKNSLKEQKIFKEFCELNCNRREIIVSILEREGIPYSIINFEDSIHIVLFPYNLVSKEHSNVLLAHYDRVENTPGANDNSAAVFYLLYHGKRIKNKKHNSIIIFTDKEELVGDSSVTSQGSYKLGRYLRSKSINNLSFYVFDMCGIGTTILLGTAGENLIKSHYKKSYIDSTIRGRINRVKNNAEEILLSVNSGEFFYLNPLFSDDLGLILNEYPAVLISLLPYREAIDYKMNPNKLPKSWLTNHSLDDKIETLDPRSWNILSPLLLILSNITLNEVIKDIDIGDLKFNCYNQEIINNIERGIKIKSLNDYIKNDPLNINLMKNYNIDLLLEFKLYSSELKPEVIEYFKVKCGNKGPDLTYNIYKFVEDRVKSDFKNLPLIIRKRIDDLSTESNFRNRVDFFYNNILKAIENDYFIKSIPLTSRSQIKLLYKKSSTKSTIEIMDSNNKVGSIELLQQEDILILNSGEFDPKSLLKLDPSNLLKGLRLLLIKISKLNNNNCLSINFSRVSWLGCSQLYKLIQLEMDGRENIKIWKRYYGNKG